MAIEVSYCVVNTNQRELLVRGLDAIARERATAPFETEVLVLDNASTDGSAAAARAHRSVDEVVALRERTGKAANDSALLARARGRYGLLLNEDSELLPGATRALHAALEADPRAGAAGAALLRPDRREQPSAWRFPSPATALASAVPGLGPRVVVQSGGGRGPRRRGAAAAHGETVRVVDWAQSAALLVRRAAGEQVGWLDPAFFVYSDEVDFCKRLRDAGWHTLHVPHARAIHHEQLSTGAVPERRIVELSRNRDRYMRKHHGRAAALAVRGLTALAYAERAAAALALPGHDARRYWRHVTATLRPAKGVGLREAAAAYNAALPPARDDG